MSKTKITVLMSLYKGEKAAYFRQSLNSIFEQTLLPEEVLVVLDGPISDSLKQVLDAYVQRYPAIHLLPQEKNLGLGYSLAIGVKAARNNLIARMDTDDIMRKDRLALQAKKFEENPNLTICGSNIAEFADSPTNIISRRNVPEHNEEIRQFSKKRNPFNHMTVMYKRESVLAAGNYQPMKGFEDYYLWARMLKQGIQAFNIQQDLVFARTGADMFTRRGGLKYLVPGIKGRFAVYRAGLGHLPDFLVAVTGHIVVSLVPNRMRAKIYEKQLRN